MSGMEQRTTVQLRGESAESGQSVQEQASQVKDQALEKGEQTVRSQIDERSTQIGQQAKGLAQALRKSGNDLRSQNGSNATSRVTVGVADRIERIGSYLEQVRGDDLLRDAEQFARRRPWLVASAAAAAGFAASRFLKASSENRYGESSGLSDYESWQPVRGEQSFASERYPSPPTVTVGSGSAPAH